MNYQDRNAATSHVEPATVAGHTPISPERMRRAVIIAGIVIAAVAALLVGYNIIGNIMMKRFFASNVPAPVSVNFEAVKTSTV
ncbi:MAG: hypothetical protein JNK21_16415, partial [Rhodospirillaceae bacterium]|nr:hypothetical protein [Rhodospirillaceae bacterium]